MNIPERLDSVVTPYRRISKKTVEICSHSRIDAIHYHPEAQLWYTLSGAYEQFINGTECVLPHGSMIFIPPFAKHSLNTLNQPDKKLICCSFFIDSYNRAVADDNNTMPLLSFNDFGIYINGKPHTGVVLFEGEARASADAFFSDLLTKCNEGAPDSEIFRLISRPLSLLPEAPGEDMKPNKFDAYLEKYTTVCKAVDYIYHNYSNDTCVDDVCKITAMSKTVFFKTFRMITGNTFLNYVNSFRLNRVKSSLIATDLTLDAIAYDCGFTHKSHLIQTFKSKYHCSPGEYKKFARPWYEKYGPKNDGKSTPSA